MKKVFDDYQKFNEYTIKLWSRYWYPSEERSDNEFRVALNKVGFTDVAKFKTERHFLKQLKYTTLRAKEGELIETRGTAQIWRENADHFPFIEKWKTRV